MLRIFLSSFFCLPFFCQRPTADRKMEDRKIQRSKAKNNPGAGAKIVLSMPVKNHSLIREFIDEDRKIIELYRAERNVICQADINSSSHRHRKGVSPESEFIVAKHRDELEAVEFQPLSGNAHEDVSEGPERGPVFRIVFELNSKEIILDACLSLSSEAAQNKVLLPLVN